MLLNNQWIIENIKEEIKKYLDINENEKLSKTWDAAEAVLREKFIVYTGLPQETRKISNKQHLTLGLKQLEKEQTKLKVSTTKEIIKMTAETKLSLRKNKNDQ